MSPSLFPLASPLLAVAGHRQPPLAPAATGYSGPAPLTGAGVALRSWTADPVMLVLVVLAAAGYLGAVALARRRGLRWPVRRSACFLGLGLGSLVLATMSWIGTYARVLLWVYTLQIMILLVVTPTLLALGRPIALLASVRPGRLDPAPGRLPARLLRVGANPAIGALLVLVVTAAVFLTGLLQLSLQHVAVYQALRLVLLGAGFVFALPLAGDQSAATALSIGAGIAVGIVELLLDAIPGIVMRLQTHLYAPAWVASVGRPWGPTPLADQQLGGALLWGLGEAVDVPFLVVLVMRWIRADEREAHQVDRVLDELAVSSATGSTRSSADPGAVGSGTTAEDTRPAPAGELTRPWWESDGSVFDERRAAQFRRAARSRSDPAKGRPPDVD